MKVYAAGADPAELRRCVEDELCEGVVLLGDATDLSPAARAGATWVSPALTGASPGTASGADHDAIRKTRALLRTFGQGAALPVGPLGDEGVLFDVTVMGAHVVLAGPEVLRRMAARRAGAAGGP